MLHNNTEIIFLRIQGDSHAIILMDYAHVHSISNSLSLF